VSAWYESRVPQNLPQFVLFPNGKEEMRRERENKKGELLPQANWWL
jgi:hypothetical protein